ncbi:MAG: prohibitin family protein [Candidatus Hodarchaeales archaeon]
MSEKNEFNKMKIIAGIIIAVIIIGIGFVFFSFQPLEYTKYGIAYNSINNQIDKSKVYESGLYFLPAHRFIKFPKTLQIIEFSADPGADSGVMKSRTSDGLAVTLEISFQYQLIKEEIIDLYTEFGTDYKETFIRIGRDVVRDIAGEYTAIEFFSNRTFIGDQMHQQLDNDIREVHAIIPFFQLRNVDLPDAFENSIEQAEVARQDIQRATFEQQAAYIRAQTLILEAQAQANITLIDASAGAEAFLIQIDAQAKALNITLTQEALSYYALSQQLGFNSTELLAYLWIQAILEHDSSLLIIGGSSPILTVPINNTGG